MIPARSCTKTSSVVPSVWDMLILRPQSTKREEIEKDANKRGKEREVLACCWLVAAAQGPPDRLSLSCCRAFGPRSPESHLHCRACCRKCASIRGLSHVLCRRHVCRDRAVCNPGRAEGLRRLCQRPEPAEHPLPGHQRQAKQGAGVAVQNRTCMFQ